MYPTLIICIVNFKQTIWETDAVGSTLQFVGQSKSGGDDIYLDSRVDVESTGKLNMPVHSNEPPPQDACSTEA